ncbi:hypothetical protein JZ751_000025 [Albula glossodonta]|uniref:Enhancer of polycomb homolog n=1 Tax=Albula glossodonta TaxID=121402 RepID=A0A8T2PUR3_9TELE|nr:hypothetical protein JZ751_000025 [Albula glossodonta]
MVIPVPEAESNIAYYESLYPGEFKMPKQLIHIQPFSLDTEQPDYDLDSEDEAFLNKLRKKMEITPLQFEEMIDRLEKGSGQQMVTLPEAKLLLKEDDELIREVFDYWTRKRKSSKSASLIPTVKQEKRDGSSTNDPYVAFRRRTEKMQTRKNRKNDEASYEKMLKLRRDLSRAVTILEMIKRREKSKRELLHLTLEIIEKRYSMADFGGEVMAEVLAQRALVKPLYTVPIVPLTSNQHRHQEHMELKDFKPKPEKTEVVRTKRKYEKKPKVLPLSASAPQQSGPSVFNAKDLNQYDFPSSDDEPQMHSGSSEVEEENDPDGTFAFRRKAGCQYHASRLDQSGGWSWCGPSEGGPGDTRYRYCLTTLTVPRRCVGLARRRLGRGGRVLLDRAHSDFDNVFHGLDPEMLASPPRSPADKFTSTSETNTSERKPSPDLSQILLNIKSCRWRHFRPRTLPLHHPDCTDAYSRKHFRGLTRTSSAQPGTQASGTSSQNRASSTPVAAFTAEQYQQHQEQLALMQKQQLEQSHLQQASAVPAAGSAQGLVSKTLDSASAQFAASALVTTDQLTALKAKEEAAATAALGAGVNGVLQASGEEKRISSVKGKGRRKLMEREGAARLKWGEREMEASGVYKGLHLTGAQHPAPTPTSQSTATVGQTFLHPPAANSTAPATAVPNQTPGSRSHQGNAAAAASPATTAATATQVLIGSSIRLAVPAPAGGAGANSIAALGARHLPRTINAVPPSALKLAAAAAASCQIPKVTTGSPPMELVPR